MPNTGSSAELLDPELGQHFSRVLAQGGHRSSGTLQADDVHRVVERAQLPHRTLDTEPALTGLELWVLQDVLDAIDGAKRDVCLDEARLNRCPRIVGQK